ncbi:MAG: hypothetical protein NVSMB62_24750 [Acidobacteriaceae bacterium]
MIGGTMHHSNLPTPSKLDRTDDSRQLQNSLESLVNIFYLLRAQPENFDLVRTCADLGARSLDNLIRELTH